MRVLIATGIYPPDIGGPATYAKNLVEEFSRRGNKVKVLTYGIEKKMPIGVRHCFYFFRLVFNIRAMDFIIALDTFSVGWPAVCAAMLFRKKIIIRTGGDFLWESYVERTGDLVTLSNFYKKRPELTLKQKLISHIQKFVLKKCSILVFSTEWQKEIWKKAYCLKEGKLFVIENFYGNKVESANWKEKNFLWSGRQIKLKNVEALKSAFESAQEVDNSIKLDISKKVSHEELMKKIKNCYTVILPTLSEISPNFILEAIRYNKPFILTQETGFYDRLKGVGVFVDPLDEKDIKNKILFLAKDKNYKEYKKRVEDFDFVHTWGDIVDEFLNIYKEK